MRLVLAALVLAFTVCRLAAAEPTKIKGFYIGMKKEEVTALMSAVVNARYEQFGTVIEFRSETKERGRTNLASFELAEDGTVKKLLLNQPLFDPDQTMKPDEFVKAAAQNYPFGGVRCQIVSVFDAVCEGRTPEGHRITARGLPINSFVLIEAENPTPGRKPRFD